MSARRPTEPRTAVELAEVLDDMRALCPPGVANPAEHMPDAQSRAVYRLTQARLEGAYRREHP